MVSTSRRRSVVAAAIIATIAATAACVPPPAPPQPQVAVPADIVAAATSEDGAVVTFEATASFEGQSLEVSCNPASGSLFPVGTTRVRCTATNDAGTLGSRRFHVTVEPFVAPPADPVISVSPGAGDLPGLTLNQGQTVTINGSGFTETGNLGVRPPFFNTPAGVYVVFGRFAETWKVSDGAPSSARQIIEQVWALPTPSYNQLGGLAGTVEMGPGGTFSITVTVTEADGTNPNYGIAIFPGSGAINPAEEIFIPITLNAG